jgi:hypothetical protein
MLEKHAVCEGKYVEADMAYFKVPTQNFRGGIEENNRKSQSV